MSQFERTELLIGKEAMEKLAISKVIVFGIGGVGGYTVEALARSGIGRIDLVDKDVISITNLNRQIIASHSTIGRHKVDVAKERMLDINPNIIVNTYKLFYSAENADRIDIRSYDYVVDAIDTVKSKVELISRAVSQGIPIISSMGAGNKMDPTAFIIDDIYKTSVCPLAKVMRKELRQRGIGSLKVVYSKETPIRRVSNEKFNTPGTNSFVPPTCGLILAGELIKDIINK